MSSTLRRPGGWTCEQIDGKTIEHDCFTCKHCQKIVIVPHKSNPDDLGGLCYGCMSMVCPQCVGRGCDVIEKKLDRAEASYHARRSYEQG